MTKRPKKFYYVCASSQPWILEESIHSAYSVGGKAFKSIPSAKKALEKERLEWTGGGGYFDLKILSSRNKGKTFELIDEFDGMNPLNPSTYHGVLYKKKKGVFV